MESVKELLALRKQIKARKPSFVREESWRYKRVRESWRKPRGIDSHMRKRKKGWPKLVKIGYRGPKAARYLHPSGYHDILVHNVAELSKLDQKRDAARIASSVGKKKRKEIAGKARTMKIKVLNP
ncbi:MAG: 50S ribosomal protein L32e [Nitrososphaerales archaeon]